MLYLHHRSFLDPHDPLHQETSLFAHRRDTRRPPKTKSMTYIDNANGRYVSASTTEQRKNEARKSGCKGTYTLRQVPGHDRLLMTPVEPMHLVKNIAERIVHLISGIEDSRKVHLDEQAKGRFSSAWVVTSSRQLPPATFVLSSSERKLATMRAESVHVTAGFDWKPRDFFNKTIHFKSHEWKQVVCSGILKF